MSQAHARVLPRQDEVLDLVLFDGMKFALVAGVRLRGALLSSEQLLGKSVKGKVITPKREQGVEHEASGDGWVIG